MVPRTGDVIGQALDSLSSLMPWRLQAGLRRLHSAAVFRRAMKQLLEDPLKSIDEPEPVLRDLIYGWGNEAWVGQFEYLHACMRAVASARQPVLECGSGLTTVVLGAICRSSGNTLWSLEHDPEWVDRLQRVLVAHGISAARVFYAPLQRHEEFDWYQVPDGLPLEYGVVVCDGPPSSTRGGRYGLGVVMERCMPPGCKILLDDAEREGERSVARRWQRELDAIVSFAGSDKPFVELTVGAAAYGRGG